MVPDTEWAAIQAGGEEADWFCSVRALFALLVLLDEGIWFMHRGVWAVRVPCVAGSVARRLHCSHSQQPFHVAHTPHGAGSLYLLLACCYGSRSKGCGQEGVAACSMLTR